MPSIIQSALALEALLNVPAIVSLSFYPNHTINRFAVAPYPNSKINGTTEFLARSLGLLILALTPQLLLAYPNNKDCVGKRKLAYVTLGTGEAMLIPLLLWEAYRADDESKAAEVWAGGLSRSFCLVAIASLAIVLAWRIYVFGLKSHWFGDRGDMSEKIKRR